MPKTILGISGSPINNSNTDRLIKKILEMSDVPAEFVKLSDITVKPCFACKRCVYDNICKINDDFPELSEKIQAADTVIIGGYTPYGQIDAFTKALLERLGSLRHLTSKLAGKNYITVTTGINPAQTEMINNILAHTLSNLQKMNLIGQIAVPGNITCASCGTGDSCPVSGIKILRKITANPNLTAADLPYKKFEDQPAICQQLTSISQRLTKES